MITPTQLNRAKALAAEFFEKACIVLSEDEKRNMEVADFGLGDLFSTGLELVTYINTNRVCAKEMVLFPGQACPEHRHSCFGSAEGKEETFRCRYGEVFLYVGGEPAPHPAVRPPSGVYTVFHEIILKPGMQYTIFPNTLHWFKAGKIGAVISEFSTASHDEYDIFSDIRIKRKPEVKTQ